MDVVLIFWVLSEYWDVVLIWGLGNCEITNIMVLWMLMYLLKLFMIRMNK